MNRKPSFVKYLIMIGIVVALCIAAVILIQGNAEKKEDDKENSAFEQFMEDLEKEKSEEKKQNEKNEEAKKEENTENEDYILPESDDYYLDESDLSHLSREELRLARNEIYARKGRKFTDKELQAYFNSKNWYEGRIAAADFDDEKMLTDVELKNARLILDYEKKLSR